MAGIADAMRMVWILETIDNETAVWRMHAAKKGDGLQSFVHGAMETFYEDIAEDGTYPILGYSTLLETRIQEWDSGSGQFVQTSVSTAVSHATTAAPLPLQCAAVLTYNATQPFGGRRQSYQNRLFLGPLQQVCMSAEGKLTANYMNQTLGTLEAFQDDLQGIANASGVTFTTGLAIVSEKLGEANPIVEANMGNIIDTQRRRRRSLVESRVSTIDF